MGTPSSVAILVVDDHASALVALGEALQPLGERVLLADSAAEGVRLAQENELALAIVDIRMPVIDGFGVVEALRKSPARAELPVIFVSAFEISREEMRRVYRLGAVDFVSLPVEPEMLRSKVAVFVRLYREQAKARDYAQQVSRAAASEVQQEQERFQLLVEAVSDYALFFLDPLGLVSEWTASAERLLGYTADEITGKHFRVLFTAEDRARDAPAEEMETAITGGQSRDERIHLKKDGTRIPVTGRLVALRRPDGTVRGFAKIMRDATQIVALKESETRYRRVFETANEGIWILNSAMVIEVANRRMAEMLGYEVSDLIGRRKIDFVFPEDESYVARLFEERRTGKIQPAIEVRFRHRNGTPVWTLLSARPIAHDGHFAGALDMFTDITERKHTELELAEHRTRLRLAIETADLGVFFFDSGTGTSTWSDQFKRLLGLPPDAPETAETFFGRVHPDDRAKVDAQTTKGVAPDAGSLEWEIEYRVVWPNGTVRWIKANVIRETTAASSGPPAFQIIGTARDITAEKEFESELKRQIADRTYELDEKTKQLESFSYTVAHDLRAPLRAINGFADYAIEEIGPTKAPQVVEYLERIRSSTKRLDVLISDLLAYSRINQVPVDSQSVDLAQVVDAVLQELEPEIRQKKAEVNVGSTLPKVIGEQSILEQILLNLVGNALKFAPPGQRPHVEIFAQDGDGRVRVHVRDRGIGIAPEYHQRIFKVFERLQSARAFPGTGIGLAIVARGMERMGGGYGVDSAPGRGSTFWIDLKAA